MLPLTVVFDTDIVPSGLLRIPPPVPAVLPLKVLPLMVALPPFDRPPPADAVFPVGAPVTVTFDRVNVLPGALKMPPPAPVAVPSSTVTLETVSVA
jgi:hypothetical protein